MSNPKCWTRGCAVVLSIVTLATTHAQRVQNPRAATGDDADTYHGTRVADPYRWLEAPDSPARAAFISGQAALLDNYLSAGDPRDSIARRVRNLIDVETISAPIRGGDSFFYSRRSTAGSGSNLTLLMRPVAGGDEQVLLPPVLPDGTRVSRFAPSPDGALVAFVASTPGQAAAAIRIVRTIDKQLLSDAIPATSLSGPITWSPDSKGFYYSFVGQSGADTSAVEAQRLAYHPLQGRDSVVHTAAAGDLIAYGLSAEGRYLVISSQRGSDPAASVSYLRIGTADAPVPLVPERTAAYTFLGGRGDTFWFYTDDAAPKGRIVAVDIASDGPRWREVVQEGTEAISARDQTGGNALGMHGNHLVLTYIRHGNPFIRIFTLDGAPTATVEIPSGGSIWGGFAGRDLDDEVMYSFLGLADPGTIYRLNLATGESTEYHRPAPTFDRSAITVTQEFYTSWDGTRIPMFIAHRKDFKRDGRSPGLMYGYGALGWVSFIWYQPHVLAFIESGGVYAQPSIRGGGEYGQTWHQAALKTRKMTAVKDYVAAAEWLVQHKFTSSDRLVGNGGSLSAPLVSAAARLKPGLFGALLIDRPVTDMIRFEKFTGGRFWSQEFGTPEVEEEFRSLIELSPYHAALKPSCLPPTLVMAGDRDLTAPLLHGLKLTAALQANQTCDNPILLKVMRGAGHDFGRTVDQQVDSYTDLLAFLRRALRMTN